MISFLVGLIIGFLVKTVIHITDKEEVFEAKKQSKILENQAKKFDTFRGLYVGDTCFFFMNSRVCEAVISSKEINFYTSGEFKTPYISVCYTIDKNPCGTQYTTRFHEHEVHPSKEELLKSL